MNVEETGWEGLDWTDAAHDMGRWKAGVNKAMNSQISKTQRTVLL